MCPLYEKEVQGKCALMNENGINVRERSIPVFAFLGAAVFVTMCCCGFAENGIHMVLQLRRKQTEGWDGADVMGGGKVFAMHGDSSL